MSVSWPTKDRHKRKRRVLLKELACEKARGHRRTKGILGKFILDHKKEQNLTFSENVDGLRVYYTK